MSWIGVAAAMVHVGCGVLDRPTSTVGNGDTVALPDLGGAEAGAFAEGDANDSFESASQLKYVLGKTHVIRADIAPNTDLDIYTLEDVLSGDQLIVDVGSEMTLDPAVAVFDADVNLIYLNDDRNYFGGLTNPYINVVMHRDHERVFVVVSSSPSARSSGAYTLRLTLRPGEPELERSAPGGQVVLFNFDGAFGVAFGGRRAVDIPVFDAADITPRLAGRTDRLIELLMQRVREDYAGIDVEFVTSRDGVEPAGGYTTIHFGGYDRALLGVAENVDEFNEQSEQDAIVFTNTFRVFNTLAPSIEQYAQALANVASHETGHLLGLVHTADIHGVMDITATLRQLMANQAFSRSTLESSTFPVGYQDALVTLVESVGGDIEMAREGALSQLSTRKQRRGALDESAIDWLLPVRPEFSTCSRCAVSQAKRRAAWGAGL